MFYEHRSSQENLDEIINDMGKLQAKLSKEIELLKDQNDIKKIEKLTAINLESIKLCIWKDSGLYAIDRLRVRIDGSDMLFNLIKEHPAIKGGIPQYRDYNFLIVDISEDNEALNKEQFSSFIDRIASMDEETHQENLRKVEQNRKTETALFALLERIGIHRSYYGYATKRSSKKTEQHYSFSHEIRGQIPTHYDDQKIEKRKMELVRQFAELYDRELSKVREARRAKEKEEADRLANKKLALLLAKYDLDLESEWSDVLDKILEKNKYLRLAHYLRMNREDWNEGDWYARRGLDQFTIETEKDQDIYDDISRYTGEGWDFDGRVFRDCHYNYDVLFSMAADQDGDLYRDYETVKESSDE